MKCSSCAAGDCERSYANRNRCVGREEDIECSCTCQVSATDEVLTTMTSVLYGGAAIAGGILLTASTGGLGLIPFIGAMVGGGALIGGGSSLVMAPVQKKIAGEHMTLKDTVVDVAIGATIGKITSFLLKINKLN
jgi:hypothetical protein